MNYIGKNNVTDSHIDQATRIYMCLHISMGNTSQY